MDWDNASDAHKKLVSSLMIGREFRESFGVLVNTDTKLMVGEDEFKFDKPIELRLIKNSLVVLGADENSKKNYEVIDTSVEENTVELREVVFFKAKLIGKGSPYEVCVVAPNRDEAFKVLRGYAVSHGYERIQSLNDSKFFEPFIK